MEHVVVSKDSKEKYVMRYNVLITVIIEVNVWMVTVNVMMGIMVNIVNFNMFFMEKFHHLDKLHVNQDGQAFNVMKKPVSKIVQELNKEDAGMVLAIVRMDILVIIAK